MKGLILLSLLLCVLANPSLKDPVGTKCPSQGVFLMTTCNVSPFPPTKSSSVTVAVTGTFTAAATVGQIQYSLIGQQMWGYQYQDINQTFQSGAQQTFTYQLQLPNYSDRWLVQIIVNTPNSQNILGCWEFAFQD